jgi:hypothetical protein
MRYTIYLVTIELVWFRMSAMIISETAMALVAGLGLACASPLAAQSPAARDDRAFVTVTAGAQPQRRDFETAASFTVYGETATVRTRQHVDNGPVFDVHAGYRVWRKVAVGGGYSSFQKSGGGVVGATVPDPLVFNRPKTVNGEVSGLSHHERVVYLLAMWVVPVTRALEVGLTAGPSFMQVSQQVVSTATVAAGTQAVTPVVDTQRKMATGVNAGIEVSYMLSRRFSPVVFARFNGGTVNLPSVTDLKVGGVQTGLGGRFRF